MHIWLSILLHSRLSLFCCASYPLLAYFIELFSETLRQQAKELRKELREERKRREREEALRRAREAGQAINTTHVTKYSNE